jgi:hypothetical protein
MSDVPQEQAGLASGVVNTAFMMGGAVGLAVLASLADSRSSDVLGSVDNPLAALNSGYHAAFLLGTAFLLASAALAGALLRVEKPQPHGAPEAAAAAAGAE